MSCLHRFALFLVFVTALFRPAAAGAFVSEPDAGSQARVGAIELVAATLLGPALEAAGHVRPASSAAHHIVADNAPAAAQTRAILQRFGIGINDAANGVFLPARRAAPSAAGAALHSPAHTNAYDQTVNRMLGAATPRAEAEAALSAVRSALFSEGL
ncbi:MAG: AHH domain-containing protein [Deltaproteobacteria bacterium]|nr:AHH domain-containing protein [Deltaproteobacteria bacterium]